MNHSRYVVFQISQLRTELGLSLTKRSNFSAGLVLIGATLVLGACATTQTTTDPAQVAAASPAAKTTVDKAQFMRDRASILAMSGDYKVTFDFTETVSYSED